jgi:hypothetical protein
MPRHRPGKRQREQKRAQDQQAINNLNERLRKERNDNSRAQQPTTVKTTSNRIEKQTPERKFTATEVDSIVQAAVSAAVKATVTATKELVDAERTRLDDKKPQTKSLADRITKQPTPRSLAERISFPDKR